MENLYSTEENGGIEDTFEETQHRDRLREATIDVAVRFVGELVGDAVVFDIIQGEAARALMRRLGEIAGGGAEEPVEEGAN